MSRVTVWSRRCWIGVARPYRRTGWAGWRMCWEPCPVVLRLPFGERAGLLGDSLFSTSSWSLSLFLSCCSIGGFPSYLLTLPSTIKRIEHDYFRDVCFISTFLNKVSYQQSQTDPFSGIPLRSCLLASAIRAQERWTVYWRRRVGQHWTPIRSLQSHFRIGSLPLIAKMGTGPLCRYRLHLPDLASYHLSLAANAHVGGIHHEVYSRVLQRGL